MGDMKASAGGITFIARWELLRLRAYPDEGGRPTIAYGHLLRPGEAYPDGITREQALALLAGDVGIAEHNVNTQVLVPIGQNAFDALVSFVFNCGGGALAHSSVLAYLNRSTDDDRLNRSGNFANAARALLVWDKVEDPRTKQLVESRGLFARRVAERDLFLTPDIPAEQPTSPDLSNSDGSIPGDSDNGQA